MNKLSKLKSPPNHLAGKWDYLKAFILIIFWVIPILTIETTNKKFVFLPRLLNDLYRISHLFTRYQPSWPLYYYQVLLEKSPEWTTIDERELSTLKPFGYRNRITRFVVKANFRPAYTDRILYDLSLFIKNRYEELHPDQTKVIGVRFFNVPIFAGKEMAKPKGRWNPPPFDSIPAYKRTLMYSTFFE